MISEKTQERINQWLVRIDQITAAFEALSSGYDTKELNAQPGPSTWSIAQNLDHLITINESYYATFDSLKENRYRASFVAKLGFLVSFFGNFILKSVRPDNLKKVRTFPIWEPSKSPIEDNILHQFSTHQEELKKYIVSLGTWIEKKTVISSPANKNIVYTLEKAIEIIVTHEERHLEQAKRVGANIVS